jgi:predicted HicB family RNase H-like nuclease
MTMEHRGYTEGPIDFDPEDGTFSGIVVGLKDVIHFEGTNAELLASFQAGIDDYLAICAFNGKILVRTTPELHRKAAIRAAAEGVSLSQWISRQRRREVGGDLPKRSRNSVTVLPRSYLCACMRDDLPTAAGR